METCTTKNLVLAAIIMIMAILAEVNVNWQGVVVLRYSVGLVIKRSRVRVSAGHYGVKTLGKFLTPMCLCHQAV